MSVVSYSAAVAHGVLSSSSAWAIWQTRGSLFALIGFLLYFVNGLLGMIAYGVDCVRLYRVYSSALTIGLELSLPLFLSQLYSDSGMPGLLALTLHLSPLLAARPLSHAVTGLRLASLLYISLSNGYYFGPLQVEEEKASGLKRQFELASYLSYAIRLPLIGCQIAREKGLIPLGFSLAAVSHFVISWVTNERRPPRERVDFLQAVAFFIIVFVWSDCDRQPVTFGVFLFLTYLIHFPTGVIKKSLPLSVTAYRSVQALTSAIINVLLVQLISH